ncbi:hypothetical protein [Actinoplanes sp. GCM10030250]|uniref:hypothetical protein n=1 Tax=Actinoplanes sp. GCM10030250 TaxID=3273376 RepID=UPI00361F7A1F
MTFEEIERVRHALHLWRTTKAVGPNESRACTDLFDLLLSTGCRIGGACALRWHDGLSGLSIVPAAPRHDDRRLAPTTKTIRDQAGDTGMEGR